MDGTGPQEGTFCFARPCPVSCSQMPHGHDTTPDFQVAREYDITESDGLTCGSRYVRHFPLVHKTTWKSLQEKWKGFFSCPKLLQDGIFL